MIVADVDGVQIASVLLESSETKSPTLLEVGDAGTLATPGIARGNPIFLFDIFCRAGGAIAGETDCMVTIHSNNVVGDNFWLWRADHGAARSGRSTTTATP